MFTKAHMPEIERLYSIAIDPPTIDDTVAKITDRIKHLVKSFENKRAVAAGATKNDMTRIDPNISKEITAVSDVRHIML